MFSGFSDLPGGKPRKRLEFPSVNGANAPMYSTARPLPESDWLLTSMQQNLKQMPQNATKSTLSGASQFHKLALIPQTLLPKWAKESKTFQSPSPHLGDLGEGFRVRVTKVGCFHVILC
jgi:hypothetical protein